ncbi:MAG: bifunctional glutamate N-acetyltransferase/amino-acid acetyltransferase ArgJ [Clostridiales bacterium]|nr:bifunctional glutamate N-acetyltransferase/amino-acid acetyltransferase ArgJ [Clostridiales bacterium]
MAGVKTPGRYDLTIVYSTVPATMAAVFTENIVRAAPVTVSQAHLKANQGRGRAVVFNSGCANACTGDKGAADAAQMTQTAAEALGCSGEEVLVASTGVIGAYLPMDKILAGIGAAAAAMDEKGGGTAARAIMTTDLIPKEIAIELEAGGKTVTIGAMAKGSGMIHPNMATLLAMVTTDCAIEAGLLREALGEACDATFNMVTVDGDTSTNDSLFVIANGAAGNEVLRGSADAGYREFVEGLTYVCKHLAQLIARDGEGATKYIEMKVEGAKSRQDARLAAKAVVGSSLVKAAIYGKDANWGRILCAMGYSGADFDPDAVDLYIGDVQMMDKGKALIFDEAAALVWLEKDEVRILAKLNGGEGEATAWGCDLTHEYVTINGSYRS